MLYQRQLNPKGDDSLALLSRKIPIGSRVLELGPATGYLSRYLTESLSCTVDAIELSTEMAGLARQWCRRIIVGDVETLDLSVVMEGESYDVIICADVIEHLRDPWMLARRLKVLLREGGHLLLSVPNAGYLGLLVDLMRGHFNYRDEGLLDRSHLRFFTFESLRDLLEGAGWHLWAAEQVVLALADSEFHIRLETLSPVLRDELMARPDALCYQWVVEARLQPPAIPFRPALGPSDDRFQVRLFWRSEEMDFDYSRDELLWARLGSTHEVLEFCIPAGQLALALRLTDRAGFIRLHELELLAQDDVPLWHWRSGELPISLAESIGVEFAGNSGLWFIHDVESRLVLDLLPHTVAAARRLRIELDAPVTADFLGAKAFWDGPDGLPARLAACETSRRRLLRRLKEDAVEDAEVPKLTILHVLPPCGGGLERFVRDLSNGTNRNCRHFSLRVTASSIWLEDMESASHWPFSWSRWEEIREAIIDLDLTCVHVHATDDLICSVAHSVASSCETSLLVTLHDVLFADPGAFSACHFDSSNADKHGTVRRLLETAQLVTAPSRYIADLARRNLGIETVTIANGIDMPKFKPWDDRVEIELGDRKVLQRIVVLGALGRHKGGASLFDIAASLPGEIVIIVIGFLDGQLETGWACEHHRTLSKHPGAGRIFVTGPYAPSDLPALFERYKPQIVLFPGLVPESFSYTLSEVWSLGGIPCVPSLGALGERTDQDSAVRFDITTSVSELAKLLDEWCSVAATERRNRLRLLIRTNLHQLVPTLEDMARSFNDLYKDLSNHAPSICDTRVLDKFSTLCEMTLDPAQFRTELRLMMEEIQALRKADLERQQWNQKLEGSITELKARNVEVESQLAILAETSRNQQQIQEKEMLAMRQQLISMEKKLEIARASLGENDSDWVRNGRIVRAAKKIPGLNKALDFLASLRNR